MTVEKLISKFEEAIAKNQVLIDKFKAEFEKSPYNAFLWQGAAFKAVTQNTIFVDYLSGLNNHGDVESLIGYAQNEIKTLARNHSTSTSVFQNIACRETLAAEAEALKILESV